MIILFSNLGNIPHGTIALSIPRFHIYSGSPNTKYTCFLQNTFLLGGGGGGFKVLQNTKTQTSNVKSAVKKTRWLLMKT